MYDSDAAEYLFDRGNCNLGTSAAGVTEMFQTFQCLESSMHGIIVKSLMYTVSPQKTSTFLFFK